MCGIAGIMGEDPPRIAKMTQRLLHRGPDGHACWTGNGISLGHTRLAILDPRADGNQPMWNAAHTIVIVYNGEIYNYRELRNREKLDCRTDTDTEVILQLYERYGAECISMLEGMYAIGIYDTRDRTLLLARDPQGIKPLFISHTGGGIAFASEMRALMAALPAKPSLDYTALSLYLRLQYVPGPRTLCEGIEQLQPGTVLQWQNGSEQRRVLPYSATPRHTSKFAYRESLPTLIGESVEKQLVSDKPLGVFLSGGMDSSIVLHHMAQVQSKPIDTFTVRFEATDAEGASRFNTDADLARMTAAHYGTNHHEILLTAKDYAQAYRATAWSLDQPNADTVSVAQYLLAKSAKQHVDVVLTGSGGDELFGGYPRYRIARLLQLLSWVPSQVRSATGKMAGYPPDVLSLQPGAHLAERLLARPHEECRQIVQKDWFVSDAVTQLFAERFAMLLPADPVRQFMEFDRNLWLPDESLRLADAVTMAHGVECRVPLLDESIRASAIPTPGTWHTGPRSTKALLKDAYRNSLPAHLYSLDKASFYPPLAKWLRREAASLVDDALESAELQRLFDVEKIRTLHTQHKSGGYHLHALSSVVQLGHWFQEVYDA